VGGTLLTIAPQLPQNFVVSEIGAPQLLQVFTTGGAGTDLTATTGVPQIPQNFSDPDIGVPHEAQTYNDGDAAGTGVGGAGSVTGAVARSSGTFTRHLLQNLSPGFIGFPHALQVWVPDWGAGAETAGAEPGGGGGGGTDNGSSGSWLGAGGDITVTGTFTRHLLQNLSPG
jgi:hypothetical protein